MPSSARRTRRRIAHAACLGCGRPAVQIGGVREFDDSRDCRCHDCNGRARRGECRHPKSDAAIRRRTRTAAGALSGSRRGRHFLGCSNGGREGLIAAQRYPELFDGVVAGSPAFPLTRAMVAEAWNVQAYARIAPSSQGAPPNLAAAAPPINSTPWARCRLGWNRATRRNASSQPARPSLGERGLSALIRRSRDTAGREIPSRPTTFSAYEIIWRPGTPLRIPSVHLPRRAQQGIELTVLGVSL
jgi:pimeloyl-ACP methyl ester carboxylesterase